MNSPGSNFKETDLTVASSVGAGGISGVILKTLRGPLGDVKNVITGWPQFQRLYGGFIDNTSDPAILLAKRALERGSALRVSRSAHYTDPDDSTSHTLEFSAPVATNIFTLSVAAIAGVTLTYTHATAVAQLFDTDALTTMKLLAAKIKAGFGDINDVIVISTTKLLVVPNGAAIAGDTLAGTGSGAPTVVRTTSSTFKDSAGNTIFTPAPKYPGLNYDNLKLLITAGSNGQAGYWDLYVIFVGEESLNEPYRNIIIPGSPTAGASTYLSEVVKKSKLITITYSDLSGISANPIVPVPFELKLHGGDDGDALVAADYIGSSTGKTGLHAFDGIDDVPQIAILDKTIPNGVHQAGFAYAEARKDLQYFMHIGEDGENEADVIAAKDALNLNSSYGMIFAGNLLVVDPQDSQQKVISELGDVLGSAAYSDKNFGLWFSFAAYNRGLIQNSLGAANDWGAAGNKTNLDLLANHQINVAINRNKRTVLWGSFTGQLSTSQLSLANVRRFHIYLKKALGPIIESYIEEPCDFIMFMSMYLSAKKELDALIPKRAIFDYRWEGDQLVSKIEDCQINDPNEVSQGRYKVKLFVKDIPSTQEVEINITLTPAGVSFEDALIVTP